jgi:hypothetical protein
MTTFTTPVFVTGTDTYTIAVDDILDVTGDDAITWSGTDTAVTVTNNGTISDSADQSLISVAGTTGTLTFTNNLGALVDIEMKFKNLGTGATVTVENYGLMSGRDNNALELSTAGATFIVNNYATGVMTQDDASKDIIKDASNLTLNNYGKIIVSGDEYDANGDPSETGGDGIDLGEGINNSIHNYAGAIIEGSRHGITADIGMTIINDLGGKIVGRNGAGLNFDNDATSTLTVTNYGTILGESKTYEDSDGDAVDADGLLDLDNYGFIGGMGANGEHDGGINHSEAIAVGGGTINNFAGGTIFSVQRGIQVDDSAEGNALAATTIFNAGIIQATDEAIKIVGDWADTLTNKGTIIGDIVMGGGNDIVTFKAGSNVIGDIMLGDGNDTFKGSSAAENVYGGAGIDSLTGGAGADTFFFALGDTGKTNAKADTIFDFNGKSGDTIDLSDIDANIGKAEDQAFKFIGDAAFHNKAGELRVVMEKSDSWIYGDTDGNGKADFAIHLDDAVALKAGYFDL